MTAPRLGLALAAVFAVAWGHAPAHAADVVVTVHIEEELGASNQRLGGLGWNTGPLEPVAPLQPPGVRIDASLQRASSGPGELDLASLLGRVAAVRAIGSEPQVILSYMPEWLAAHGGAIDPRDPTRVRPNDYGVWQELIEEVVTVLATAPAPALRFEVWNEPDLPIFWMDSPDAFLDLARATHRAVAAVAVSTGLDLEIGGPATAFADPAFIVPYVTMLRAEALPLDYVSWHHYGNHPFLGPDGAEDLIPDEIRPLYPVIGRRNPVTSPAAYGLQTHAVRAWVDAALAGSSLEPELLIDEWNVSAGGYDHRHDDHVGAAFVLAGLIEMEAAGLDAADLYRAVDDPSNDGRVGDWGVVDAAGQRKPSWWVLHAWRESAGARVAHDGGGVVEGLWSRATVREGHVDVLLAAFAVDDEADRQVRVEVPDGPAGCAVVRSLLGAGDDLDDGDAIAVSEGAVEVSAPTPSVVWVRFLDRPCPAVVTSPVDRTPAPSPGLPATGGSPLPLLAGLAAAWLALAASAVRLAGGRASNLGLRRPDGSAHASASPAAPARNTARSRSRRPWSSAAGPSKRTRPRSRK